MRSTYGSAGIAAYRWRELVARLGKDHPATRAALGRLWARTSECVPQRGLLTVESVAWHRESGAIPGYMNRAERRARAS